MNFIPAPIIYAHLFFFPYINTAQHILLCPAIFRLPLPNFMHCLYEVPVFCAVRVSSPELLKRI